MESRSSVETGRDRRALVADAGFRRLSFVSALAGVLCAYGTFAVAAGLAVGVVEATGASFDVRSEWRELSAGAAVVVAALLLVSYLLGGYVAGRMARRAGVLHGAAVLVLGLVAVGVVAAVARELGATTAATATLRDLGAPTTASEWGDLPTLAGIASVIAMAVGSLAGGLLGERWHARLLERAVDPRFGVEAEARRDAERRAAEAGQRAADADAIHTAAVSRVRSATPTGSRRDGAAGATTDAPAADTAASRRRWRRREGVTVPPAGRRDGRTG